MPEHPVVAPLLAWYQAQARDLPWRRPGVSAWGVLVSEVMLQQTPVTRVLPVYRAWLARWPSPADLADDEPAAAVRLWGRLGYPRRALRLHAAAAACVDRYDGEVPSSVEQLRSLPGVGEYTAAAVAAFAFGSRAVVLDTNVRRVHARVVGGAALGPPGATTAEERRRADRLLPDDGGRAALVSAAAMELGALVCTARSPACDRCPVADACRWVLAGRPAASGPPRRGQTYVGTDRQCRGRLLALLRETPDPVAKSELDAVWDDAVQRERALDSLVADGLVEPVPPLEHPIPVPAVDAAALHFRLPTSSPRGGADTVA